MAAHRADASELVQFPEGPGRRVSPTGRVLVVGNDERMRRSISILAQIEGCEAREIEWDGNALSAATTWDPDVVVLDLKDGTSPDELTETVSTCRCGNERQTAVIILSATEIANDVIITCGANACLIKPFAAVALLDLLYKFAPCG